MSSNIITVNWKKAAIFVFVFDFDAQIKYSKTRNIPSIPLRL